MSDTDLRDLERIVEAGEGSPEEIQRYIAMKLRGGCASGAHGALVIVDGVLVCEACRAPGGLELPGRT